MSFKRKSSQTLSPIRTPSFSNVTYYETSWLGGGVYDDPYCVKDISIAANTGDLLVIFWISDAQTFDSGDNGLIQTTAGSTSSWTQMPGYNPEKDVDCSFGCAWATVTATNNITIRTYFPNNQSNTGIGAWRIDATTWSGTPTFTPLPTASNNAQVSVNLAAPSMILYASGEFWAEPLNTENTPSNAINCTTRQIPLQYSIAARYWSNQLPGTRIYGPAGLSGIGMRFTGCVVTVEKP